MAGARGSNILDDIAAYKRGWVERRRHDCPLAEVKARAADAPEALDFTAALKGDGVSLIAEIKKASPSKGLIRADFDVQRIAAIYRDNGASALSVLTDEAFFQGSDDNLRVARDVAQLPTLRKDFTIDEYQIFETRLLGADAILLIVALLDGSQLGDFLGLVRESGLTALVEVHDEEEMRRAVDAGADPIGINNRDLRSFETTLETTLTLCQFSPAGTLTISESGIHSREDVELLAAAGVDAILVGEALMRADDMEAKVSELARG